MLKYKTRKVFSFLIASTIIIFSPTLANSKEIKKIDNKQKIEEVEANDNILKSYYMSPPKEIIKMVDNKKTPSIITSPNNKFTLFIESPTIHHNIQNLLKRQLRLAGLKIDPQSRDLSRLHYFTAIKIKNLSNNDYAEIIGIPPNAKINYVSWSPDSNNIAFTITNNNSVNLWIADVKTRKAHELNKLRLNAIIGKPYLWLSDSKDVLCTSVPDSIGEEPKEKIPANKPLIQESLGKKLKLTVYENLLQNTYDEDLFTYYFTSQLVRISMNGSIKKIGDKDVYFNVDPSPDKKYLIVEKILKPYSYTVPINYFKRKIQLLYIDGNFIKNETYLPLRDKRDLDAKNYSKLPRDYKWRADAPSTLYWAQKDKNHDVVYSLKAPFKDKPSVMLSFDDHFDNIIWGDNKVALAFEETKFNKNTKIWLFPPDFPDFKPKLLLEKSNADKYNDHGNPITSTSKYGTQVLLKDDKNFSIYFSGLGASEEGNKPFIDKLDLKSTKIQRLWQSKAPYYEEPIKIIDQNDLTFITRLESSNKQPNYYIRNLAKNKIVQITNFDHPYPEFKNIKRELIKYKREDGVLLSANLYLPANYTKGKGRLPVLMWSYPKEYDNVKFAGQITTSPYSFITIKPTSPIAFVSQGYAVLDNPSMPIIAEGKGRPNDTYIKQLILNAKAAVDKVVSMGIADPNRIAIGGHSYGAFMAANLLAHTDLFCAGISRSGAYNRTLTPFGFQNEFRTLWEQPQLYYEMSPFNYADKIKDPLLLIHGMNDDNAGTNPIQSQNMFNALNKLGTKVRFVMLPNEEHHYQARESIFHMLWEMNEWLEKYVKNNTTIRREPSSYTKNKDVVK